MDRYKARITDIVREKDDTFTYYLDNPKDHSWVSGANTHIALKGFDLNPEKIDKALVHHMSIMTRPREEKIGFTTRIKNLPSRYKKVLSETKPGDELTLYKSKAHMELKREGKDIVCLSMGVAIATFRPFILDYWDNNGGIKSLTLVNVDKEIIPSYKELLVKKEGINYEGINFTNREDFNKKLEELMENKDCIFYIAGSDQMMAETCKKLLKAGFTKEAIQLDRKEIIREKYLEDKTNIRNEDKLLVF